MWVKIDDKFFDHPKTVKAGRDGRDLFIAGLCYCASQLTDGFIDSALLPLIAFKAGVSNAAKTADTLVSVGLWEWNEEAGGYQVHDYLEYNPPAEKILAERAAAKERMSRARSVKRSEELTQDKPECSEEVRPKFARSSPEQQRNFARSSHNPVPVPVPVPEKSVIHRPNGIHTHSPPDGGERAGFDFQAWFDNTFWPAYPNKKGKAVAKTKLARYVISALRAEEVMAGLCRHIDCEEWARGYIQHASTWVNGQMWQDEPAPAGARASPKTTQQERMEIIQQSSQDFAEAYHNGTLPPIDLSPRIRRPR